MSVRRKVAVELGILAVLVTVFLLLFPGRTVAVDVGLAAVALVALALSAGYTRRVIWAALPPVVIENRLQRCFAVALWITVPTALLFLLIGGFVAYRNEGWPAAAERVFNWRILVAFGCYLPWALMQQTLFQFYLLGRLLVLFPEGQRRLAVLLTGISYSVVHLPDIWTTLATAVAGIVWSTLYYRYRLLLPLAFAHAALGSAFYCWLLGRDLVGDWKAVLH